MYDNNDSTPPAGQNETNRPYHRGIYSGDGDLYDESFQYTQGGSVAAFARNRNYKVKFEHQATGHSVSFPCIVENLSDTHDAELSEQVFMGKMDPLVQQTSTGRKISFSFKILNASVDEARYNAVSINMLLQMMYPRLQQNGNIEAGSFLKIHGVPYLKEDSRKNYQTCLISKISYDLNTDEGFITPEAYELHPISISINIEGQAVIPTNRTPSPPAGTEDAEDWASGQMQGWLDTGQYDNPYPANYPSYIDTEDPESERFLENTAANAPADPEEPDPAMQTNTETVSDEDF
jgi:hypothetical protein